MSWFTNWLRSIDPSAIAAPGGGRRQRLFKARLMSSHPSRRLGTFDARGHKLSAHDIRCLELMGMNVSYLGHRD